MAKAKNTPKLAPVEEYKERPLADALDPDRDKPREQVDQIEDYHQTHPTLDVSGPEHDPDKTPEPDPVDPQAPQD